MNLEECFEKRLLRKIKPDYEKARRSIEVAKDKLKKAKDAFDKEFLDACLVYGYTSMFHSARSLLYKDGIQEKSHACIVLYLKEKYSDEIPYYLIQSLDSFRKERHEALYGLDFEINRKDALLVIKDAEEFIEIVKNLLK